MGTMPLADLAAPAAALARDGVEVDTEEAYVFEILAPIYSSTPESRELFMPEGRVPRAGDVLYDPALAASLERLGTDGAQPFYEGDIGAAICDRVCSSAARSPPPTWRRTAPSRATRCTSATAAARC